MKFSVIVPVYNAEQYVASCIKSVLSQTYKNYELILVDDGSRDRSGLICDEYAKNHSNIFVYHKPNGGQLHTRCYGIKKATGDYYVFLDADDKFRHNALEKIREKFLAYDCDCIIFQYAQIQNGKVIEKTLRTEDVLIEDKRILYKECFSSMDYNAMWRKAVKASVLAEQMDYTNYYHLRLAEDMLSSIEILKNSKSVAFISDILYDYMVNDSSITNTSVGDRYRVDYTPYQYLVDFLRSEKVWDEDDFRCLREYHLRLYCNEIIKVCNFNISLKRKKQLLNDLRNTQFFKEFLAAGKYDKAALGNRRLVLHLFSNGYYGILMFSLNVYTWLRRLRKTN